MSLCVRVDLDYVPWDTPDAAEFGHGEPAMVIRLLEYARHSGLKLHAFASNRVLRAFPATVEAFLNEGHDVDWLCKHPTAAVRYAEALTLFENLGHAVQGLAYRGSWPDGLAKPGPEVTFTTGRDPAGPVGVRHFPEVGPSDREAVRSGAGLRQWADSLRTSIRDAASRSSDVMIVVRPQVLAKVDPRLKLMREILDLSLAVDLPCRTLRDRSRT